MKELTKAPWLMIMGLEESAQMIDPEISFVDYYYQYQYRLCVYRMDRPILIKLGKIKCLI